MTSTSTLTERIAEQLELLAETASANGMRSIADELVQERLPALREGTMTMVVLGEFNHGKSTVINALLGADVLPTGITPTTSVITHIRRGSDTAVTVVRDTGRSTATREELRQLVTVTAPEDLRYVELSADSPFLRDGLVLVDTPGVNDISQQRVEITYGYVPRADVVLYVLDATQALKRSELTFIESRLLKGSRERLFFLLGKTDALSAEEVSEITSHVRSRLSGLLGDDVPIFPVSARRATRGEDPAFDVFREAISTYLDEQRQQIVLEGAVRAGRRLASMVDQNLAIERGALELADDELEKRIAAVHERLSRSRSMIAENLRRIDEEAAAIASAARDDVQTFARDFAAALPREVSRANTDDVKRYLPDFIHDTFKGW
ncbi:MAG: dynamin family protein, partial [Myxococcales bacterium]|nr:dynamin family protein [Myxococcales bacterium]